MRCFYDGGHGDLPEGNVAEQITLWFLLQYRLDEAAQAAQVTNFTKILNGGLNSLQVTSHSKISKSNPQLRAFI